MSRDFHTDSNNLLESEAEGANLDPIRWMEMDAADD
jgi:hypothetical protein